MKEHDHVTESFTVHIGGRSFPASRGENLGSLLQSAFPDGRAAAMSCGGHGKCGKCKVRVSGAVSALTDAERKYLTEAELAAGMRLACQTYAEGNVELTLPEAEHGARIITDGELPPFTLEPGFEAFGAAVDIGTTTVAAALYDARGQLRAKASMLNPQRQWGADVISRMEAALAGSAADLADAIRGAINELLIRMAAQAGIGAECIDGAVITGNTVMLHLLAGINTKP
ncbi:MAG: 2Fe-2S iron-sulfur cluster binding domain-containing protein, partial [Clostridia bacterium]|nr:2Fe-2S iron-sulfur cluster binding domain-containing protein [Clostridia bacterium]